KIDKSEARINWARPAAEIDNQIRGLSPFPGAWTEMDGERLKLLASRVVEGQGTVGEVLTNELHVACGQGAVELLRLQRAGKGAQDRDVFLRGWPIPTGTRLT
ncbi:MAG: methionyl-tRNA formyltransferase, partial [Pseudomonadota bacterium]